MSCLLFTRPYLQVMGGYDFPGSNSNIDLYALTGWVPERIAMRPGDPTFNAEAVFDRLHDRFVFIQTSSHIFHRPYVTISTKFRLFSL